jgi:hypothetical protein
MKTKKTFCRLCGTQKLEVHASVYDENTGELEKAFVCPQVGCPKNCAFYGCKLTNYWFKQNRCVKCGEVPYCCDY